MKCEKRIIRTHDDVALRAIATYKPKTFPHWRVYALVATILDTGCRIEEALNARVSDFDLDNLLLIVYGKVGKNDACRSRLSCGNCHSVSSSSRRSPKSRRI